MIYFSSAYCWYYSKSLLKIIWEMPGGVCHIMKGIIWCNPITAVYCDYYNAPGECSWHYEPCGTVTAKTCKDRVIGQKFSAFLEGKTNFNDIHEVLQIILIF